METVDVLGVKIQATSLKQAVNQIAFNVPSLKGEYVTFVNVHTLIMAKENTGYDRVQRNAAYCFADGHPIAKYQRMYGFAEGERVAGPDFMAELFRISEEKGFRHFFYGGNEELLILLQKKLKEQHPHLHIAGVCAPPEKLRVFQYDLSGDIAYINKTNPDFVWVGLGAPKQELWMARARGQVAGLMLGVGAAFDFFAGTKKRAPQWMQRIGLEWLYRMVQEPERLAPRYVHTNIKFVILCMKEKLRI